MPTYEYACKSCGERLEVVQSFTDDPLTRCPACKKKQLRKVFGSIGITFKGSGFYKTDSRSGSTSSPSTSTSTDGGSTSGDGAGAGAKEPSKSESAPSTGAASSSSTSTAASPAPSGTSAA